MSVIRAAAIASALVAAAACAASAGAGTTTFFGEDLGLGETTRLPAHPNADAANASFLASLPSGVGTEDFEAQTNGAIAPLNLSFPGSTGSITATLNGTGSVANVPTGTNGFGRYPTSGDQYWETGSNFSVTFSAPVAAFGFFATDIGDFGGQVTLTLSGGGVEVVNIPNTINGAGGSVLFFGLIKTAGESFTSVAFGNTAGGTDFFGFDDFTIGDPTQVAQGGVVPLPTPLALAGAGLFTLAAVRRRR